jgi:hypothetical protein
MSSPQDPKKDNMHHPFKILSSKRVPTNYFYLRTFLKYLSVNQREEEEWEDLD